jgi:hypothetical protein
MAVKKAELVGIFNESQRREITLLENAIDEKLKKDYAGGVVNVAPGNYPHEKVKQEIIRRYTEAGWKIKFESDQREGPWFSLS